MHIHQHHIKIQNGKKRKDRTMIPQIKLLKGKWYGHIYLKLKIWPSEMVLIFRLYYMPYVVGCFAL